MSRLSDLRLQVSDCRICVDKFAATKTAHAPRPVFWLGQAAPILVVGQAPGARVHESGKPFDDRSGDRLRDWMGIGREVFYDQNVVSVLPMAFCFPGYDAKGSDLPPPAICRQTWHADVMAAIARPKLILLIGAYAQKWHFGAGSVSVTERVENWRAEAPLSFPLPHPSWRNTGWIKKHPWFEAELVPALQAQVNAVMVNGND